MEVLFTQQPHGLGHLILSEMDAPKNTEISKYTNIPFLLPCDDVFLLSTYLGLRRLMETPIFLFHSANELRELWEKLHSP